MEVCKAHICHPESWAYDAQIECYSPAANQRAEAIYTEWSVCLPGQSLRRKLGRHSWQGCKETKMLLKLHLSVQFFMFNQWVEQKKWQSPALTQEVLMQGSQPPPPLIRIKFSACSYCQCRLLDQLLFNKQWYMCSGLNNTLSPTLRVLQAQKSRLIRMKMMEGPYHIISIIKGGQHSTAFFWAGTFWVDEVLSYELNCSFYIKLLLTIDSNQRLKGENSILGDWL